MHVLSYCRVEQQPIHYIRYKLHWGHLVCSIVFVCTYRVPCIHLSYRLISYLQPLAVHVPTSFPRWFQQAKQSPQPKSWSSLVPSAGAATAAENERSRCFFPFYLLFFPLVLSSPFNHHMPAVSVPLSRANSFLPVSAMVDVQDANAVSYTKLHALAMIAH